MNFKKIALASAIGGILAGCGADDQQYETVERDAKEFAVKDLKVDGRWFYVPTTGAAPRFALNQFPFLQGMGRYVELCFTETGLDVRHFDRNNPDFNIPKDSNGYCLEQDMVGSDDISNFAHVLTIPGDFAAYRCAEDSYGDCTNKEEVNKDASLGYRSNTHFTPDPTELDVVEFNYEELYGLTDGLDEVNVELVSWDFDPKAGVLNFELERTFRVDLAKISNYINFNTKAGIEDALSDGAFKSRFHYSLVHESIVASKDYEPILYPVGDENDIGYFTTASKKLNPITNKYDRDVVYLNRFNPNLESIKYYLSDNFFEDKNKLFLDSTIETIDKMNKALELFGADSGKPHIEIVNQAEPAGIHPGDLRYNVINLVDEPLANGLLGYGPSVGNPVTGEIIKAHVNQYSGVARTGVPFYWDNLVRFYNRNQLDMDGLPAEAVSTNATQDNDQSTTQEVTARLAELSVMNAISNLQDSDVTAPSYIDDSIQDRNYKARPTLLTSNVNDEMDLSDIVEAEDNRLSFWAENNAYPIEASWVSSTSKASLETLSFKDDDRYFNSDGELLRWKHLPAEVQREVADAITVATYSNTLVHEIGHNVGLRHNFKGSNDKDNYYTLEQARALGLQNIPAYSSTMDYAPSMLDETPTWGLYDIAAFKFAYGRIVETVQDSSGNPVDPVTLPENPSAEQLADYQAYQDYLGSFAGKFGADSDALMTCTEVETLKDDAGNETGQSLYNCDFSKFDEAARNNSEYAKTRYGALYYLENFAQLESIQRKSYAFCTDGNVSLNSDCNRFDEGTNLEEIVQYKWQNYLDSFDRRNAAEYTPHGMYLSDYPSYIVRRFSEMSGIRDKIEDLERIDNVFTGGQGKPGDLLLSLANNETYCREGDDTSRWFCDYANGAKLSAAFFLDVLRTPEHQCVIQNGTGEQKVVSLGDTLNRFSFSIPADYDIVEANCFDNVAADAIEYVESGYTAVAETANGRFLNSIGSFDPDVPYSNAIAVFGHWPDKVIASHFLARRDSGRYTDEVSFASLLDLPGVKAGYDEIIANLLAEEPLTTPIKLVDEEGNEFSALNGVTVNLHKTVQMESLNQMPRGIESFLGISDESRDRISDVILKAGLREMRSNDYKVSSRGKTQFDSLTKQQDHYGLIAGKKLNFVVDGQSYVATDANTLAYKYATQLVTSEGYDLKLYFDSYARADLTTTQQAILSAWGGFRTEIIPAFHDAVLLLDAPMVNAMKTNIDADIVANVATIGESFNNFVNANIASGDLVFDQAANTLTYNDGKAHLVDDAYAAYYDSFLLTYNDFGTSMMFAVDNVYAGYVAASDEDKQLWLSDVELLSAYLEGDISAVAGKYYELLERIPNAYNIH
ncbi:MoxR-like ATPase [Vibrio sp. T187]|uniref:zinc-dependent metalloprotease n=1 Tax=Vibrio TaxID=662 RepID=UPI0010C9CDB4|nr:MULTISPECIES: zinc-dependent metalloprotease [Vibrio]MBW3694621.1 MoxR-like ATPase [Vibrio sp. T187]